MSEPLTITALHASGFEISLQVPSLDAVEPAIADLLKRGYRPARAGDGWQKTPAGEPICPKHQAVMRLRNKQNEEWWSHRVINRETGEELYCRGYRSPAGPGWDLAEVKE